ncbi:MAG: hypothetical protein IT538_15745 [Variibacter sp.]|nr:hypothetical protein [Variibacter sp.]
MQSTLYTCPVTGQRVNSWVADAACGEAEEVYVSVLCAACQHVHLVHPRSGRIAGAELMTAAALSRGAERTAARQVRAF